MLALASMLLAADAPRTVPDLVEMLGSRQGSEETVRDALESPLFAGLIVETDEGVSVRADRRGDLFDRALIEGVIAANRESPENITYWRQDVTSGRGQAETIWAAVEGCYVSGPVAIPQITGQRRPLGRVIAYVPRAASMKEIAFSEADSTDFTLMLITGTKERLGTSAMAWVDTKTTMFVDPLIAGRDLLRPQMVSSVTRKHLANLREYVEAPRG